MKSGAGGEIENSLGRDLRPRQRVSLAKLKQFLEKFFQAETGSFSLVSTGG
jgi:hypothetical protein